MNAAMEGRKSRFRSAIAALVLVTAVTVGLSFYKKQAMVSLGQDALEVIRVRHAKMLTLFQANYYFFFEEQFLPGVKQLLAPPATGPGIQKIQIVSTAPESEGELIFDSSVAPSGSQKGATAAKPRKWKGGSAALSVKEPELRVQGFGLDILVPSPSALFVYHFDAGRVRWVVIGFFLLIILLTFLASLQVVRRKMWDGVYFFQCFWRRFWKLRARYIFAIILINLVMAGFLFVSLVSFQTREQTLKTERDSRLFGEFSTQEIVSDFMNFFYFYYGDRFVPEIRKILASNENLLSIRIVSRKTGQVLFASSQMDDSVGGPRFSGGEAAVKADFVPEVEDQLKKSDLVMHRSEKNGDKILSIVTTYRNESKDALFWVEYQFAYNTLKRDLALVRMRILRDMVPSSLLGIILAIAFAQLMISPIRKMVEAHKRVASGDYDISVDLKNTDEIGDLASSFNTMTSELKKKRELRKYLSDSTYRQIMEAPDSPDGLKLAGTRVNATVLFTDIRNFVAHCEALEAEEVTAMLNEHFSAMVDVVYKHGGEVDKFIGDALLAVFYAADDVKTIRKVGKAAGINPQATGAATSLQAIYCALEMRERLTEFNKRRELQGKSKIEIGVGITFGEIISGPVGAKDRMDFTVIGDVVNLASRIEKLSKQGTYTKVVFSNHVEEKVRGLLDYYELATEKIRGKEEDIHVYELIGIRDLKVLIQNLKGSDLSLKRRSVELLGQSRNPEALAPVIAVLRDPDEETVLAGIVAVGKLANKDDRGAIDALFSCLRGERSVRIVSTSIATLGRICTTDRLLALESYLESQEERVIANAVEAIGQLRTARATDLLLPKINSVNNRIKANASMALFAAGHVEVIDTLKPMLMHSNPLMRSSAAFAIGELTLIAAQEQLVEQWKRDKNTIQLFLAELQECVPMLVSLLKDADIMVKRQAVIALGKIKDKSAVLPIIEMVDPNHPNKELMKDITQALRSIGSHSLVREVIARLSS